METGEGLRGRARAGISPRFRIGLRSVSRHQVWSANSLGTLFAPRVVEYELADVRPDSRRNAGLSGTIQDVESGRIQCRRVDEVLQRKRHADVCIYHESS